MKKVMVGILVIIPVIIVLVVAMVSIFVSMSAHIAVDDITLDKKYLELEYDSNVSAYKLEDLFDVKVTPDRASDKSYSWSVEDLVCIDTDYKEMWEAGTVPPPAYVSDNENEESVEDLKNAEDDTCSQDGYLHINTYCSFILKAQAETHVAVCQVYVVGFKVEKITISCATNLTISQNALITVETDPVEAIVDTWHYESSDENIVTVDKNGVINAVGAGTATIKVKASVYGEKNKFVESTINITVTDDVTLYGNSITTSQDEILFSQLGVNPDDVVIVGGATLNGNGTGIVLTNQLAIIEVKGKEVDITKCETGDIVIDNANLFEAQEEGGYVLATESKLYLSTSFADVFVNADPNVTWSSNRETIAKVDKNGVVTGVGSGRVVITATTADGKSASVTINVREVVTVLLVETPDACEQEGIAQETINGSMSYVDVLSGVDDLTLYVPNVNDFNFTKKNNSFEFNFQRPALPEGADKDEFYSAYTFKVQEYVGDTLVDSDKAYFNSNVLTFNGDAIDGPTDLVVTISAKYPKFASRPEYTTVQFTV
ncbi:MAG: Ig-like domain-containing protein, partial [Clostridia bacterium]|nr:Ig-like domain-containing protein [Clostridia bacterium]